MPITVANPDTWTVGNFYLSNFLQPSRYKLYVVLNVSLSCYYKNAFGVKIFLYVSKPLSDSNESSGSVDAAAKEGDEQTKERDEQTKER